LPLASEASKIPSAESLQPSPAPEEESTEPDVPPPAAAEPERTKEEEPATEPEARPAMEGTSLESYARMAKEKNRRSLFCMLRDARKKLAHHGRHSFMGREAKKEIAAAEAEIRNRGSAVPAEGEETKEWEKTKK
jgi:hypothetical protein